MENQKQSSEFNVGGQKAEMQQEASSILIPKISLQASEPAKPNQDPADGREKVKKKFNWTKKRKIVFAVLIAFLLIFGTLAILVFDVYRKGTVLADNAKNLENSVKEQDIDKLKTELDNTEGSLRAFDKSMSRLAFLKYTPYFGFYVTDVKHGVNAAGYAIEAGKILIEAVEPYADIIGFTSGGSEDTGSVEQTTQERVDFVVKTLPDLIPKADSLIEKATEINNEVSQINPHKYPEKIGDRQVRSKVESMVELVNQSVTMIQNGKPLLEVSPYLLGANGEREYLILFQNDKELRPTGGFLTAYSIGKVEKGRFEPVFSSDIYNLDSTYQPSVPAPDAFVKYLKGPYVLSGKYRLRDMNWSPDFKESMELFIKEAESVDLQEVDGIIAVDTQVLVNILDAIGPVDVPGFGTFSNDIVPECNCPQVIFELESFADIEGPIVWSENEPGKIVFAPPNYDNRKKIIGPLMNSVLANALGLPKEKMPALFEAGMKSLTEKHVLFYMHDKDAQSAVETFGVAGRLKDFDGDYLFINDANLGGRKSNLYVTQDVMQEIEISEDGGVVKTVTLTYKNPEKHDGWLNSVLPNYLRVYVPQGSELLEFSGVTDKLEPYEELGKSVFAGFFEIRPQGVAQVTLKYKLPFKAEKTYNLFLQKQPGKDSPLYTVSLRGLQEEFFLKTDREIKLAI